MKSLNLFSIRRSYILTSLLFVLFISACQTEPVEKREYGWFDFVVPDLDTTVNVVDMSFLNIGDAGGSGFITLKDGHFADGNGEKIRFFGTNLTFSSSFPDKETAALIAGRLRKLGMNVVRFHHMDMRSVPQGIWDKEMKDLDPGQLDKLDWLVYQLKIHGIYSNINTHVSRTYPGMDYKGEEQFDFGKTIDQFYRPYIEMQKEYAKKLLTHRNPYTGNSYADEPAVAFVEVNNENSLLSGWAHLPDLNKEHKASLISQWKEWLNSNPKYRNNQGLKNDLMGIIKNYDVSSTDLQKEMNTDSLKVVTVEIGKFSRKDNKLIDSIPWVPGFSGDIINKESTVFVYVRKVLKPEVKELNEARGLITADYQNYLEKEWIASLRAKYPVDVKKDVLAKIK